MALGVHQVGRGDPTTRSEPGGWWHATLTPSGPGTVHIWWSAAGIDAQAWGPGSDHLLGLVPALTGALDPGGVVSGVHPAVATALRNHPDLRLGHSRNLFHTMLPVIIGQRVTTGEARESWRKLCAFLGERAPGPQPLRLPPEPSALARRPYWWFHRLGMERKRADAIREVASHAELLRTLDRTADLADARRRLALIPGIGVWTIGCSLGPALGDPDAFAIGDYWLKHIVCDALAGEPRGTDERMVELLEPYVGQRGRVVKLLNADGWKPRRYAPSIKVLPIASL